MWVLLYFFAQIHIAPVDVAQSARIPFALLVAFRSRYLPCYMALGLPVLNIGLGGESSGTVSFVMGDGTSMVLPSCFASDAFFPLETALVLVALLAGNDGSGVVS